MAGAVEKVEVLRVVFTHEDVQDIANEVGVPFDTALERVTEWAKYVQSTVSSLAYEQLTSVIEWGQP